MKTRSNLKFGILGMAMLATTGSVSALDIRANWKSTVLIDYNFQPGQELISYTFEEDNSFARYSTSSFTAKVNHSTVRGIMSTPLTNIERVSISAGISAIVKPGTEIYRAEASNVSKFWDYESNSFIQNAYQPIYQQLHFGFSEERRANNSIVLSDSSFAVMTPFYGYGPRSPIPVSQVRGSLSAKLIVETNYVVNYQVDSAFDKFLGWLDNVDNFNTLDVIRRTIRERLLEKSQHAERSDSTLYFRAQKQAPTGSRGEMKFEGITVHTASPGVLAYTATLPDALTIDVPLAFTKNNVGAVLDVAFDGQTLASFRGDDYLTDEINLLNIDISSFAGRTGELTFTVNTTGPVSAEIFVAERLGGLKVNSTVLTPVPEASTYSMMLVGLGLVGFMARRRKNTKARS